MEKVKKKQSLWLKRLISGSVNGQGLASLEREVEDSCVDLPACIESGKEYNMMKLLLLKRLEF
jgi:hypothetical protein